jgi:hypothetical protein
MATEYTPAPDDADYYRRYKRAHDAVKLLRKGIDERAVRDMSNGATVSDMAELTGLADEVFRRLGRKHGIERLREPTVGRDAKPKREADTAPPAAAVREPEPWAEPSILPSRQPKYAAVPDDILRIPLARLTKLAAGIEKRQGAAWVASVLDRFPGEAETFRPYRIVERAWDQELVSERDLFPQEP